MKLAREALDLSRPAFATKSGCSVRTLENNEKGANEPGACLVAAFLAAGINANWLLTGDGPMLLKDLEPKPVPPPQINVPALSAIIEGLCKAGLPPATLGPKAVRYYLDALGEGLITPTGIGEGDGQGAA